jgi:glycosyltransferase involved in cell wall biosynthesis
VFGGAGKIMTGIMRSVASHGVSVSYVGAELPHLFSSVPGPTPTIVHPPTIEVTAIPNRGWLEPFALAEAMADVAHRLIREQFAVTLWGTYLLPYSFAAMMAKKILISHGHTARLVVSPAGSDIWQMTPQLPYTAYEILFGPEVNARLTYTRSFSAEIGSMLKSGQTFDWIYPIIDHKRFRPVSTSEKLAKRQRFGISSEAFVICCHCNMRPVKRPEAVMRIAASAAQRMIGREVILMMVGPPRTDLIGTIQGPNLTTLWTGVADRVEGYLQMSDVELNWSCHDSFNGSLAEAMSCGLPVISSDVVGIAPEVRKAGGFLCPAGDESVAVERVIQLANDPALGFALGQRSAAVAFSEFSEKRLLPQYMRVLFG